MSPNDILMTFGLKLVNCDNQSHNILEPMLEYNSPLDTIV
jgi:hypothetical protein